MVRGVVKSVYLAVVNRILRVDTPRASTVNKIRRSRRRIVNGRKNYVTYDGLTNMQRKKPLGSWWVGIESSIVHVTNYPTGAKALNHLYYVSGKSAMSFPFFHRIRVSR